MTGMSEKLQKDGQRCIEGLDLGSCSTADCDGNCCNKLCNSSYSGANPHAYCGNYPGFHGLKCLCQHDCWYALLLFNKENVILNLLSIVKYYNWMLLTEEIDAKLVVFEF